MDIIVAPSAGFCYGVKRAVQLARKTLAGATDDCYTLGPIIHNPTVVEDLRQKGLVSVDDVRKVREGTLVIRSHGVSKEERAYLRRMRRIKVVDATCPFVQRAQDFLLTLWKGGYKIFYLGDRNHPEVKGLLSYVDNDAVVFTDPAEIPVRAYRKTGLISQTTQKIGLLRQAADRLVPLCEELRVFNTICKTTMVRQREALEMASKVDIMLVLGGKNSANTRKLAEVCRDVQPRTMHVEELSELDRNWFKGVRKVGITAGASTPKEHIADVIAYLESLGGTYGKF